MESTSRRTLETWLPLGLLGAAALLIRVLDFLPRRSFWLDEAMLGINIHQSGFLALLGKLEFDQAAPVGFLWAERLMFIALGPADYVLRFLPFAFGALSLVFVYLLARQNGGRHFAWFALALVALSPAHLRYSGDLKQYSLDVLVSALLLWGLGECIRQPSSLRVHQRLAFAGALAVWCSHPSMFMLAGIGLGAVLAQWRRWRDTSFWKTWTLIGVVWVASFALLYAVNLRFSSGSEDLHAYWLPHFAPAVSFSTLGWYITHFIRNIEFLFSTGWMSGTVVTALVGWVLLVSRKPALGLAIGLAMLATLVAARLAMYPFYGRLLMFMMPAGALLLAEAADGLRRGMQRISPKAAQAFFLLAVVAMLYLPVRAVVTRLEVRSPVSGMKPLIPAMQSKSMPEDQIFVYYGAVPEFRFYAPAFNIPEKSYWSGGRHRTEPAAYRREMDAVLKNGRVWFVFSHGCCARFNEHAYFSEYFAARGALLDEVSAPGATAYLYRIDRPFLAGDVRKD